jgi:hypothetical protein
MKVNIEENKYIYTTLLLFDSFMRFDFLVYLELYLVFC